MPNGWEDRLWWYTWYCGKKYSAPWQNREILDEMNIKYSELRQKKMQEKLVIDFSVDRICEDTNYIDVGSIADDTLYIPYFDRYSDTARVYKEPKYFQFRTVIFGDGYTSNVNMRTEQAKIIYTPPTMNIIDFNSFDSNGCELFVYSNSRLKLVNLGVFNCIRGSDRTSMIKEGIEGGYFKSKLKIHLRKCIYDYAMIDYPEFSELFISDIV